jgi:hypothetical protein
MIGEPLVYLGKVSDGASSHTAARRPGYVAPTSEEITETAASIRVICSWCPGARERMMSGNLEDGARWPMRNVGQRNYMYQRGKYSCVTSTAMKRSNI